MSLKFSVTICKFSKLSWDSLLKIMPKMPILDLNKRGLFQVNGLSFYYQKGWHPNILYYSMP